PSYLSFITGMSVADLTGEVSGRVRWRILGHALAFVVGFAVVFVALGASFSAIGQVLLDYRDWIRRLGGILIVVFGLYIVGVLRVGILGARSSGSSGRSRPVTSAPSRSVSRSRLVGRRVSGPSSARFSPS